MLSKTFGNVTVYFEPLIILGIFLVFQIVRAIILELKFRAVVKNIYTEKYDEIIRNGEKLMLIYKKYNARLSTKPIISRIEYLNYTLAVSYFSLTDDTRFLKHINALTKSSDIKEFWLSLFYLQSNDFDTAQIHYDNIVCNEDTYVNRTFLNAFCAYKKQENEVAKNRMMEVINLLTLPVLKQLADEVLKSKN